MNDDNVQSLHGVTLVGAGPIDGQDIDSAREIAPNLVAADGGANICVQEGHIPKAVIGDFDSLDPGIQSQLPESQMIKVDEQDSTDFEKCLSRIEAPFVIGVGFTGGRIDHLLAACNVLSRRIGPPTVLLGSEDVIFAAPKTVSLDLNNGTPISLFPMKPVRGISQGLRWPIDELKLEPGGQIATSNRTSGPVSLNFENPGCLILLPRSELRKALKAIVG